jgi:hypothetical protein
LKFGTEKRSILSVTQDQFDKDLLIRHDDTGVLMPFPEQEEGFVDNPIRRLFERVEELDVENSEG